MTDVTGYHKLSGLKQQNLWSYSSGGQKSSSQSLNGVAFLVEAIEENVACSNLQPLSVFVGSLFLSIF